MKNKKIISIILLCCLMLGYGLGQIPMLGNYSEKYNDLKDANEHSLEHFLWSASQIYPATQNFDQEDCASAVNYLDKAIDILNYNSTIETYDKLYIKIPYSDEDIALLQNYAIHYNIILRDLLAIKNEDEYKDSETYSIFYKVRGVFLANKNRDYTESYTYIDSLLDALKEKAGRKMFEQVEEYCNKHHEYTPYEICDNHRYLSNVS